MPIWKHLGLVLSSRIRNQVTTRRGRHTRSEFHGAGFRNPSTELIMSSREGKLVRSQPQMINFSRSNKTQTTFPIRPSPAGHHAMPANKFVRNAFVPARRWPVSLCPVSGQSVGWSVLNEDKLFEANERCPRKHLLCSERRRLKTVSCTVPHLRHPIGIIEAEA